MKPGWTLQIILLSVCLAMNGLSHLATSGYAEQVEVARQTPPPEGLIYLDTCDGRPTDITGECTEPYGCENCLADYPGEFARGVTLVGSIGLFLVVNLFLWIRHLVGRNRTVLPG